ncbi:Thivi_2564 family membrane protein [Legionella londiniensis]|uniref:Transmembrane protein n=1 Tax=Legionella londiniensis TaxID=45068 RepID=A0A0W0VNM7_9GAMM|nr:Thivi_2564 family membrane protein [Legionella londiniensis]KTD21694.1 hypothetical protein Llon_0859 [Legionella londiniensis]STX93471.1 Uncharacterised protein [Legionella londiniensis]
MNALLNLLLVIIVAGVLLWLVNVLIPMAPVVKRLLNVLVLIILILYILQFFGLISPIVPMFQLLGPGVNVP